MRCAALILAPLRETRAGRAALTGRALVNLTEDELAALNR